MSDVGRFIHPGCVLYRMDTRRVVGWVRSEFSDNHQRNLGAGTVHSRPQRQHCRCSSKSFVGLLGLGRVQQYRRPGYSIPKDNSRNLTSPLFVRESGRSRSVSLCVRFFLFKAKDMSSLAACLDTVPSFGWWCIVGAFLDLPSPPGRTHSTHLRPCFPRSTLPRKQKAGLVGELFLEP